MLRASTAILLVLLIGNPICCCATDLPAPTEAHSCCQHAVSPGNVDEEPGEAPAPLCPCSKLRDIVVADKRIVPPPTLQSALPTLLTWQGTGFVASVARPCPGENSRPLSRVEAPPVSYSLLYRVWRC